MNDLASQAHQGGEGQGLEALRNFLNDSGVECEVVSHERTLTARAEARAAHVDPQDTAKTVVLRADDEYRLAVVPASERVDLRKVRELLGVSGHHLALATEAEIAEAFPAYEVGALPPVGPHTAPEIVDRRLLEHDRVLCSGADHTHGILLDPNDIVRVAGAQVADICEEPKPDE
jgi:Ala-tRNA(Pro) deacylase